MTPARTSVPMSNVPTDSGGRCVGTLDRVQTDRETLNLVAAVLCGVGSLAALADGLTSGGFGSRASRAGILSGLFGTIGSMAWALAAFQDRQESRAETKPA